jgi:hypothetical protein
MLALLLTAAAAPRPSATPNPKRFILDHSEDFQPKLIGADKLYFAFKSFP